MNSDKVEYYTGLVKELCKLPKETKWVEFKLNVWDPEKIGEYISALSNAAAITKHPHAYIVWGIDDNDHKIIGTKVSSQDKVKGQELENYLLVSLEPKINFNFYELEIDSKKVVLLEIDATWKHPTRFKGKDFIRIGSNKYELRKHPEKERQLWRALDNTPFELNLAKENLTIEEVLEYIDYSSYFKLLNQPLPNGHDATIDYLEKDHLVIKNESGKWDITNLGAILFANNIYNFAKIQRKAVRIIEYNGNDRIKTEKEYIEQKGYANGFKDIISYINTIIPSNEIIGEAPSLESDRP